MLIQRLFDKTHSVASLAERALVAGVPGSNGGAAREAGAPRPDLSDVALGGGGESSAGLRREDGTEPPRVLSLWQEVDDTTPMLSRGEDSRAAEEYRILRTRILQHAAKPRVILLSSPGIGDGKTLTAVNLAATLSYKREGPVLLVDADLRRPRVHECLRISGTPGLAQVLSGALPATDAMVRFEELPALHVLPSGGPAEDPTELLDSAAARELFALLRQRFELVLVDSPPIGPLADYEELSMLCDATLLVARPDTTNRALLYESIRKVGKRLMGVVLNGVEDWFLWTQYKPEYYRHYHREPRHGPGDRG